MSGFSHRGGRRGRAALAAAVASAGFVAVAGAAPVVLLNDTFADGARTDDGTDAQDTAWWIARQNGQTTVSVVDDSGAGGIGAGNAMQVALATGNTRPILGHFASQTIADGFALTLDFDFRAATEITNPTSGDRRIRFGLYNSAGTPTTADQNSTTTSPQVDDYGVLARIDNAVAEGTSMDVVFNTPGQVLGGGIVGTDAEGDDAGFTVDDTDPHHFTLTVANVGGAMWLSLRFDDLPAITGFGAPPTVPAGADYFTFDEVVLGQNGAQLTYLVDNVAVAYDVAPPVPEPAGLGVVAAGAAALLGRRRRAR